MTQPSRHAACGPHRLVNADFFTRFIEDDNGCYRYQGSKNNYGYPLMGFKWREGSPLYQLNSAGRPVGMMTVHRAVLITKLGREIAPGLSALHSCHTRDCINPAHLYEGTHLDKMQSLVDANRTRGGENRERSPGNFIYTEEEINWIRNCQDINLLVERFGVSKTKATMVRYQLRWILYKYIDWPERSEFEKFRTKKFRAK